MIKISWNEQIVVGGMKHDIFKLPDKNGNGCETVCGKVIGTLSRNDVATGDEPPCHACYALPETGENGWKMT